MTLRDTILLLEQIAAAQPAVNMIVRNDIYKLNACPDALYGAFAWTQGQHSGGADRWDTAFSFSLFYVDRLTEDGANQVDVQSTAVSVLTNILRAVAATDLLNLDDWTITTFNERFADMCAGAFAQVTVHVPADTVCVEEYPFDTDGDGEPRTVRII